VGLNSALAVEQQRASKAASLIIGVGGYAEQAKHSSFSTRFGTRFARLELSGRRSSRGASSMSRRKSIQMMLITALAASLSPAIVLGQWAQTSSTMVLNYQSVVPLGEDALLLQPASQLMYLRATAESVGFAGWRQVLKGANKSLLATDGKPVRHYPPFVDFQVTASFKPNRRLQPIAFPTTCTENPNECVLNLRFRLKIFRGIDVTMLEPTVVKLLGPPPDVSTEERTYRVCFKLPPVPVEDRVVLEVLSPTGERLTKFHLEFI
jgi:hypothetical protein